MMKESHNIKLNNGMPGNKSHAASSRNRSGDVRIYRILLILAVLLSILTFTPLIMPYGKHAPKLLHMPYTLWTGLITALLFVLLTWIAVRVHPGKKEDNT